MPTGLLEVTGTIDLDQFWPVGTSDADTTKILVQVGQDSFRFRASPAAPFQATHVFDDAIVVGTGERPVIDTHDRVTIRLQGIDAPELHYRPRAARPRTQQTAEQRELYLKWNLEYRQRFAETATVVLHHFLEQFAHNPLPCTISTAVDTPNDVFDTYGRLVGDLLIHSDGPATNVNQWLVKAGYAVPTFYASMDVNEIATLTNLYKEALATPAGIWDNFYTARVITFKWNLVFRGKGAPIDPGHDIGQVILPKLFRRQATYKVNQRAQMVTGTFESYLKRQRDEVHLVDEFLEQGPAAASIHLLHDLVTNNVLQVEPNELVFREKPSRLRKPGGGVVDW